MTEKLITDDVLNAFVREFEEQHGLMFQVKFFRTLCYDCVYIICFAHWRLCISRYYCTCASMTQSVQDAIDDITSIISSRQLDNLCLCGEEKNYVV